MTSTLSGGCAQYPAHGIAHTRLAGSLQNEQNEQKEQKEQSPYQGAQMFPHRRQWSVVMKRQSGMKSHIGRCRAMQADVEL